MLYFEGVIYQKENNVRLKNTALQLAVAGCALFGFASASHAINISGWTGVGNFGTLGADGVVTLSPFPETTQYGYVSTAGGVSGVGLPGVGGTGNPTTGSVLTSVQFAAKAGDALEFYFNYVTSDGAGFADYGWARLLDADLMEAALLFTARTTPGGDTVPGFAMPTPAATLVPTSTPIIGGAPTWSALGGSSGTCWSTGCGYTGWVKASYVILADGNYFLEFGVVNWNDSLYQSGLAFDGATIAGVVIGDDPTPVPEPITLALLGVGLLGLAAARRKQSR